MQKTSTHAHYVKGGYRTRPAHAHTPALTEAQIQKMIAAALAKISIVGGKNCNVEGGNGKFVVNVTPTPGPAGQDGKDGEPGPAANVTVTATCENGVVTINAVTS